MIDEVGYSQEEKIFNLQLIIQKLDEELRLYRNGTSASELLDVIHEKDIEIETWRAKCDEKEEKLKRLAKTSGDVLMKYEKLQSDLQRQEEKLQMEEARFSELLEEKRGFQEHIHLLQKELASMQNDMKQREDEIGELRLHAWEQQQEKSQIAVESHLLLQEKVAKLEMECDQLKLSQEESRKREENLSREASRFKTLCEEQDVSIVSLQKRCASLIKEKGEKLKVLDQERGDMVQQVQQFRENVSSSIAERDEVLRKKDDKIKEMTFQINMLQQEIRLKTQRDMQGFASTVVAATVADSAAPPAKRAALSEKTNTILAATGTAARGDKKATNKKGLSGTVKVLDENALMPVENSAREMQSL